MKVINHYGNEVLKVCDIRNVSKAITNGATESGSVFGA